MTIQERAERIQGRLRDAARGAGRDVQVPDLLSIAAVLTASYDDGYLAGPRSALAELNEAWLARPPRGTDDVETRRLQRAVCAVLDGASG